MSCEFCFLSDFKNLNRADENCFIVAFFISVNCNATIINNHFNRSRGSDVHLIASSKSQLCRSF